MNDCVLGTVQTGCFYGNEEYKVGAMFVTKDCSEICECRGTEPPICAPLCPRMHVNCSLSGYLTEESVPISGSNCSCKVPKCVKNDISINAEGCGRVKELGSSFIVGGIPVSKGERPWMIAVVKASSPQSIYCGATLLNTNWAMSAAHCFMKPYRDDTSLYLLKIGVVNLMKNGMYVCNHLRNRIIDT